MKQHLKNWKGIIAVVGADFGDSGKGRLIDDLASRANIVARYAGGANTGHTVVNKFGKFALHIVPSGIFNHKTLCLVGRGVAISCESLFTEIDTLIEAKVNCKNLVIDENASLTMPWHILRDNLREGLRISKIGTTKSGVGPTFADRTERVGLRVKDLVSSKFKENFYKEAEIQNKFYNLKLNIDNIYKNYNIFASKIKPYVGQTIAIVKKAEKENRNILFEGAQGFFLDIDSGTYPFVTSSNPGIVGIWRSFVVHPTDIDMAIGITKAYVTRVGDGPMPTEVRGKIKKHIIEKGHEYGTTTGRIRRPGWLDLVLIKSAISDNRFTNLAVTKLDVLTGLSQIKICIAYRQWGLIQKYRSGNADYLKGCQPVYEILEGWQEDITNIRDFNKLPKNAKIFITRIEKILGIPVSFISVGPHRGQVIYK